MSDGANGHECVRLKGDWQIDYKRKCHSKKGIRYVLTMFNAHVHNKIIVNKRKDWKPIRREASLWWICNVHGVRGGLR